MYVMSDISKKILSLVSRVQGDILKLLFDQTLVTKPTNIYHDI